ncbi:hypothetical protein RRG08_064372, partial [Elysia crispata]
MQASSILAVLGCLTSAVLALPCEIEGNFSAVTFDTMNLAPSLSYHDVINGVALYENQLDKGVQLYSRLTGVSYRRSPDGACVKFETPFLKEKNKRTEYVRYSDVTGVHQAYLSEMGEHLDFRFLYNETTCFTEFIQTSYNEKIIWAYFFLEQKH